MINKKEFFIFWITIIIVFLIFDVIYFHYSIQQIDSNSNYFSEVLWIARGVSPVTRGEMIVGISLAQVVAVVYGAIKLITNEKN